MTLLPAPLRIAEFRLYWIARFAAVLATMGMVVIIGYQVYDLARAAPSAGGYGMSIRAASFQLGLLGLSQFVPLALLTPVAGWVADRYERRTVARLANGIDMSIALALGWLTATDALSLPILFVFAALHGVARVFVGPAMSTIAPNIVPPKILPEAIAMSSIAWQVGSVIGPAIGGFLYASDPALPYWVSAGLMLVAIIAISPIRPIKPPTITGNAHPLRQMLDGLTYVRLHRFLLGAITLDLFAVLLGGATAMLPVYARDILKVGTEGLGLLRAAPAVGAALLALYYAWVPLKRNVGVKMLLAVGGFGAMTIAFGLSRNMALSLGALALLGMFDMLSVYVRSSLVQLHTPDAMRGRVSAVSGLAISASNELGEMQSGLAAGLLGPTLAVVSGGAAAIVVAMGWAIFFPELRNARTFDPPVAPDPLKGETA
ncbi:MFS transporter [Sphingomonas sp.]|uniref:MFS transporter n=1 Tax=Sphingomonas sp. TaxID=28214 RepID=UPI00286CD74E|nr:MFS transporter [Sphingomonas sp.]